MPDATVVDPPAPGPDLALLTTREMPDGGPRYTETPPDPFAPGSPIPAEPWNAVTAALFIVLALAWLWRLRGRARDYPFLACCLPILLAGGIGGTLYHATRTSFALFLLDVVPITVLGLAGSAFMAVRYWGGRGWWFAPAVGAFYVGVNRALFAAFGPGKVLAVNLSYAALAVVVLAPIGLVLLRTRFRHGGWVVAGVIAFAAAWFFRLVDLEIGWALPMGSHWLWHTFGAAATALLVEYFYRVEGERSPPACCGAD
jgi:hypothetical protein